MWPLWSMALLSYSVVVLQSLSHIQLFATPWTAARQASLPFTISCILLKLISSELVLLSNQFILCCPLLLLPLIFPRIRFFSNDSALCIRWPKYWSFSISPSNEYSGLISFRIIQSDSQVLPRAQPSPPPWCQLLSLSPLACPTRWLAFCSLFISVVVFSLSSLPEVLFSQLSHGPFLVQNQLHNLSGPV